MPNHARKVEWAGSLAASWLVLLAASGCTTAQTSVYSPGPVKPERVDWPAILLAEGSSGHRLEITREPGREWTALVTLHQRSWKVSETGCPAFQRSLTAFQRLPPLRPGPIGLQPNVPDNLSLPPRAPHAEWWTIRTGGYAPDWSGVQLDIRGSQGPYASWVAHTVDVVKECDSGGR